MAKQIKLNTRLKKMEFGKAFKKNLQAGLTARRSCRWYHPWADRATNAVDLVRIRSMAAKSYSLHPPALWRYSMRMWIWVRRHAPLSVAVADGDNEDGSMDVGSPASPLASLCCSNDAGSSRDVVSFRVTLFNFIGNFWFGFSSVD